jgi:renalase
VTTGDAVAVVGAGISGIACAREVAAAGLRVRVYDRGRRLGGRMARRTIEGRAVDVGASYFTIRTDVFRAVVEDWVARGLARPWTHTFSLVEPGEALIPKAGHLRYGAPGGLRSLVEDLAKGIDVVHPYDVAGIGPGATVDGNPAMAVALAMPDPQAIDLLSAGLAEERAVLAGHDWEPSLALFAAWEQRCWPEFDGAFVHGSPVLSWIADDGRRRGDGAPVLVAHSTPVFAATRKGDPRAAAGPMLAELAEILGVVKRARWADVKRWQHAAPLHPHDELCYLGDGLVGYCGDGWGGPPRIEQAFLSGRALGRLIAARLSQ